MFFAWAKNPELIEGFALENLFCIYCGESATEALGHGDMQAVDHALRRIINGARSAAKLRCN